MRRREILHGMRGLVLAPLLAPIARTLVSEARGATVTRKRIAFFLTGNGINAAWNFTPPELAGRVDDSYPNDAWEPALDGATKFTWPKMLAPLAPLRSRTLLVDGLANRVPNSQHSAGYGALSCRAIPNGGSAEYGDGPGGITIDQLLANELGKTTRWKSVLFGVQKDAKEQASTVFASAAAKPEPFLVSPKLLWTKLFGDPMTGPSDKAVIRRRALMDSLRADLGRLSTRLAGPERAKLDAYVGAIDELDRSAATQMPATCEAPSAPGAADVASLERDLALMWDMATVALACGLTNVLGVAAGTGFSHRNFVPYPGALAAAGLTGDAHWGDGHEPREVQAPGMDAVHGFHAGLIARAAAKLQAIREGDGTAFDGTAFVYTSDNGEQHHSNKTRWPLVIVGDAGGALVTGGRFLRYPMPGKPGARSMADLFCSLGHAVGVPIDDFGKGGTEPVQGPIPALLA